MAVTIAPTSHCFDGGVGAEGAAAEPCAAVHPDNRPSITCDGYRDARAFKHCGVGAGANDCDSCSGAMPDPNKNAGAGCRAAMQLPLSECCEACMSRDDMF